MSLKISTVHSDIWSMVAINWTAGIDCWSDGGVGEAGGGGCNEGGIWMAD